MANEARRTCVDCIHKEVCKYKEAYLKVCGNLLDAYNKIIEEEPFVEDSTKFNTPQCTRWTTALSGAVR